MCETCGCSNQEHNKPTVGKPMHYTASGQNKEHHHHDGQYVGHHHEDTHIMNSNNSNNEVRIEEDVLTENNRLALENRLFFDDHQIITLNLMGSPGSGKTTLIMKTIETLKAEKAIYVIEGDQFGSLDSDRIRETGVKVIQINTGNGCHLDAISVSQAVNKLKPVKGSLVLIENVGNLVCPSLFKLGEHQRVVVFSVTEGDDKPIKYAPMFHEASVCIINKTDLLGFVPFDMEAAMSNLKKINNTLKVFPVSAYRGHDMELWIQYLKSVINVSGTEQ
ncbi:MAG: hydrogenase nickel incorporation protein HypB [Bacteroidales bacterium]|nr:hydrogenase nickel incorporation protein HypB [Bacteroidales bacterium]